MIQPSDAVYFLLVDDLEENLLALEALLRRDGLVLLKARTGPEALEFLLQHEVALALIDVRMPGMDGFELAELMRGAERTRRVPIIFLTAGNPDRQRRFRGYEAGAVDFIQKPIEADVLRSKAEVFFDLYRQRQEVATQRDELRAATEKIARLLEESQRYAAALKEADQRKDHFLATLAHELRNPLAPIRHSVELINLLDPSDPALPKVREVINRQLQHMVRLIDDLLDVSRITRNKLELRKQRITLAEVIETAVETSRPLIVESRHELQVDLPSERIELDADPVRMAQVFANLLNNAAKYTEPGGQIRLTARREENSVVVSVRDSGIGIPVAQLPRLFEMFSQVESALGRSQGGLGIGLALVRGLVQLHGGTVQARSEGPGQGSEFSVTLPVVSGADSTDVKPTSAGQARGGSAALRVLLAEDNRDAAVSLAMLLRQSGHEVRVAYDGREAIRLAGDFRPDACLIDIGMPHCNGYEVAQHLRQQSWSKGILLAALSGWGQAEDRQRSQEAGFDVHLVKPVDFQQLASLLNSKRSGVRPPATA